jgi:ribonuclease HII
LIYEPKADETYTACQAASIIAKVTRDREILKLHEMVGIDFGKGYPNRDTVEFIREYREERGELPPDTRTRWRSIEKML